MLVRRLMSPQGPRCFARCPGNLWSSGVLRPASPFRSRLVRQPLYHAVRSFSKDEKPTPKPTAAGLPQLWHLLRPERRRLQLALAALCASSSVNLSYPYLMGRLVDMFGEGQEGLLFVMDHTALCGLLVVAGGAATFCRLYLIETAIERIAFRLRQQFFKALVERPIAFFDQNKTGELVNRLGNDITMTSRVLIDASAGIRGSITAAVGTCMIFQLAPREMILGLLSPVLALFVTGVLYGRLVRRIAERRQQRLAEAVQRAEERLGGIRTVRTFNAEARELRGFEGLLDLVYQAGWQNALASAGLSCFFVTGGGLFLLHIIYNCGVMVSSGVVSVGTTVSLAMYCLMAGSSYTGVMAAYGDIQKCLGSLQKVLDILGTAEVRPALSQSVAAASGAASAPLAVKFENVSFFYPARPQANVLQGLNLDIPAGARVAILGRSGSGKSTIALLLAGLYAPTEGKIWVDGHDMVAEDRTAWVRSQLGVISQEPTLFAMSIKENVEYGLSPDPVDQASNDLKVKEAAAAAHVTEFTDGLPHGMDTLAGERGQALSGGQKQRVCIARALARTPRMLIFDEATSALDLRSERAVHEALQEVLSSQNCSCLVITHRMSSLQWCDHVAVVEEGAVVQYGQKEEVLQNPCTALQSILRNDEF
ncbi:ATP-binding cassette sub-family B member 10 [Durusdinium trenchii]|uniref:Mitochondrial (ABC-mitochondrial erythroid protein) (ABC-me protein) (ATP-binding cassette transporter 10) (ABC transporter 10 protein) n=1 Tax=Durusdinium trenchii TaxID=1381693 RepID=A0ABP0JXE3_9DINO